MQRRHAAKTARGLAALRKRHARRLDIGRRATLWRAAASQAAGLRRPGLACSRHAPTTVPPHIDCRGTPREGPSFAAARRGGRDHKDAARHVLEHALAAGQIADADDVGGRRAVATRHPRSEGSAPSMQPHAAAGCSTPTDSAMCASIDATSASWNKEPVIEGATLRCRTPADARCSSLAQKPELGRERPRSTRWKLYPRSSGRPPTMRAARRRAPRAPGAGHHAQRAALAC